MDKELKFVVRRLVLPMIFMVVALACVVVLTGSEASAESETIDFRYAGGFGGTYWDVVHDGDYLYVVHAQGLSIFNVSVPSEPEKVGFIHTAGWAYGVAVNGDYAYVADHENGLVIVDISDPANPTQEGHYNTEGSALGVAASGDYAFVADYENGLVVVDISDPANPMDEGHYDTAGDAFGVAVSGDCAYVADFSNGLVAVDISDPTDPTKKGHYDTAGYAKAVAVNGDHAYVGDSSNGLVIVNISDPTNPMQIGQHDTEGSAYGVTVSGDHAYVADNENGLVIVDISDPTNPTQEGHYDTADEAKAVAVNGGHAFIADDLNGLVVADISDPTNPTEEGRYDTVGYVEGVTVNGDYAYVADQDRGLVIVDISDPTNPTQEGRYDTDGWAYDVAVSGDYAFVADSSNGLVIVDISDPTNPTQERRYDTVGDAMSVTVNGDYVYVAANKRGLEIVDISNPMNPAQEGHYDTEDWAYGVTVSGDYAYVADHDNGLVIVDINDPANPTKVGHLDTDGLAYEVAVNGNYAFIADFTNDLVIADISDPTNPTEKGHYETEGRAKSVAVSGDHVFVGYWTSGLVIVDISDPMNPTEEEIYDTADEVRGVAVNGDYILVANEQNGLLIVEMAPIAYIDSISPDTAQDTEKVSFAGHGTDDGTIGRYVWRSNLNGEFYNGTESEFDYGDLSNGTHTIYFRVQDNYGVWSNEVSDTLSINGKPVAHIDSASPYPALDTDMVSFEGHGADDGIIVGYTWRSSLDGELYNGSSDSFSSGDLSSGTHTIYFSVMDNYDVWSDEVSETLVVTEKPEAFIDSISPNPAVEGENVEFKSSGTDDGIVTRYAWRSSLDGEIHNDTSSVFVTNELTPGIHTVYSKVQDDYGVWSDEVSTSLSIDPKQSPAISIISPANHSELSATETISGTASDANGNGTITKVELSIDGGDWQTATGTTAWSFQWNTTSVSNGEYSIKARAFDGSNYSEVVEIMGNVQNTVENVKPTVSITSPADNTNLSGSFTIQGTAADTDDTISKVEIRIGNGNWETATGTSPWTFEWDTTESKNGLVTITARSFDGEIYSDEQQITVSVKNASPSGGDDDDDDSPGFGAGAALLTAAVVVAVVSRRR